MYFLKNVIFHFLSVKNIIFSGKKISPFLMIKERSYFRAIYFGKIIFSEHLENENMVFCAVNQSPSFKIILYSYRSITKFQNHFIPASLSYQVSKSFCTRIRQLSSFKIILYPHRPFINFQNNFVPASIIYQLSKLLCTIHQVTSFKLILYLHRSIIKFKNNFIHAVINYQVSESLCISIDYLSSF